MPDLTISISILVAFFLSLAIGLHIGFALMIWGFIGTWIIMGSSAAFGILSVEPWNTSYSFALASVPLFILMGAMAKHSGLSSSFFRAASLWIGYLPGGLTLTVTVASGVFAACSGSSLATAAAMGSISIDEMKKRGYSNSLSAGSIAAAGTFGILIPPSIPLIIYGFLTESSIGKLFMAGIIPGIITISLYAAMILIWVIRYPDAAPKAQNPYLSFKEKAFRSIEALGLILLVIFVLGGVFLGIFTATEAGGVGAGVVSIYTIILILEKKKSVNWSHFLDGIREAVKITCMLMIIIIGGKVFGTFLVLSGLGTAFSQMLIELPVPLVVCFLLIIFLYLLLGTFMENIAVLTITVPLFIPFMEAKGISSIWFAILILKCLEMALVTPPLGLNVFVIKGIAFDIPTASIFKGVIPFLFCDLMVVIILIVFPDIALWLPSLMFQ